MLSFLLVITAYNLNRLSKLVGDRLVADNPNITDLSDKNRPTKLGEMFNELYDNEWTNAFEGLVTAGYDDGEAIDTLFLTLTVNFIFKCIVPMIALFYKGRYQY